jgi:hypothetical protein
MLCILPVWCQAASDVAWMHGAMYKTVGMFADAAAAAQFFECVATVPGLQALGTWVCVCVCVLHACLSYTVTPLANYIGPRCALHC